MPAFHRKITGKHIILSFGILTAVCACLHTTPFISLETDGIGYIARSDHPFIQLSFMHGNGYPVFIRLMRQTNLTPFRAAQLVSWFSGIILLLLANRYYTSNLTPAAANLALLFTAFSSPVFTGTFMILSDITATVFFLGGVLLTIPVRTNPNPIHRNFLAGICLGIAAWIRPVFQPWFFLFMIIMFVFHKQFSKKMGNLLSATIGFGTVILPWSLWVHRLTGTYPQSLSYMHLAIPALHTKGLFQHQWPPLDLYSSGYAMMKDLGEAIVKNFFHQLHRNIAVLLKQYAWLHIPAGLILIRRLKEKTNRILILVFGTYLSVICVGVFQERYLLPLIPLATVPVAVFLTNDFTTPSNRFRVSLIIQRIFSTPTRKNALTAVLLVMLVLHLHESVQKAFNDTAPEYHPVIQYLLDHGRKNDIIVAAKPFVPYFAHMKHIDLATLAAAADPIGTLSVFIQKNDIQWVFIDTQYTIRKCPPLAELLKSPSVFTGNLICVLDVSGEKHCRLFKVKKEIQADIPTQ